MPTEFMEVQLRSSSAHCVRKLAKSLAKSWQGSGHGSGGRRRRRIAEEEEEGGEEEDEEEG